VRISENVYLVASGGLGTGMTHPSDCNVYAIDCGGESVLIDAGVGRDTESLVTNLVGDGVDPKKVRNLFLTHTHLDHSGGARFLRERLGLRVCASVESARALETGDERAISLDKAKQAGLYPKDFDFPACPVDRTVRDGEIFRLSDYEVEVIATPGHAHDMLSYLFRGQHGPVLFSGDTLFFGGKILLSNTYDCNVQHYVSSLYRLARCEIEALFPGHNLWVVRGASDHLKAATAFLDRLLLPPNLL
jgi:glyoxylase-like metal-dependent hydrolase (beta-lactamase superfamily II)